MTGAVAESYRFCENVARREARNFYYSFRLLPRDRRLSMCALYAFMRQTDDLADEPGTALEKRSALASWRVQLADALSGAVDAQPLWPAVADTVRRHAIPTSYLNAVIDGVEMDIEPRPFRTFDELHRYCYHVASAVGLCCLSIWGYRSEGGRAERLAESCGVALQLTNILRDVREDALAGRVYLPREDLDRFGVSRDDLAHGPLNDSLRALLAFEGGRARAFYEESRPLVHLIEPVGRPVFRAIVEIYRALLDEITRRDYEVFSGRVSLPSWRKTMIALRALVGSPRT